jgi:GH24 family phage-related lysozyme (muramidase)
MTSNHRCTVAITADTVLDPSIPHRLAVDVDAAEDDRLVAYKDSLENWTCGRGHLMPPAAPGRSWEGFTVIQSTSDRWFCQDLLNAIALARKWSEFAQCDTDARQNALYEIAFNLGGKWEQFVNTRKALAEQNWLAVHDHLLASLWARQVGRRAIRIANQFLNGSYDEVADGS